MGGAFQRALAFVLLGACSPALAPPHVAAPQPRPPAWPDTARIEHCADRSSGAQWVMTRKPPHHHLGAVASGDLRILATHELRSIDLYDIDGLRWTGRLRLSDDPLCQGAFLKEHAIGRIALSHTGRYLAVQRRDGDSQLWDLESRTLVAEEDWREGELLMPSDRNLVLGGAQGAFIKVPGIEAELLPDSAGAIALSSDLRSAVVLDGGVLMLLSLEDGSALVLGDATFASATFSASGHLLALVSGHGEDAWLHVWDLAAQDTRVETRLAGWPAKADGLAPGVHERDRDLIFDRDDKSLLIHAGGTDVSVIAIDRDGDRAAAPVVSRLDLASSQEMRFIPHPRGGFLGVGALGELRHYRVSSDGELLLEAHRPAPEP